jgi:hypothetical protein
VVQRAAAELTSDALIVAEAERPSDEYATEDFEVERSPDDQFTTEEFKPDDPEAPG